MVEYEIADVNRRYDNLCKKLNTAAYAILNVDPTDYEIHVKMRMPSYDRYVFFELWPHGIEAKYTLRYIPTEVVDQYFEGGLDAARHRWDVIKAKAAELREFRKRNKL
ncbi:hypothetical protein [Fibrobacter sp.]|uniref:hypothetical protein n=1 Tax=Fibrobacter sp. TaxID=35828 RepID=UPI003869F2CC